MNESRLSRIKQQLFTTKGPYSGLYNIDFELNKNDIFLDIGAGNKPHPLATHVIDFNDAEYDKQRHGQSIKKIASIHYDYGSAKDVLLKYPDNYFDFCYSSHTFEHIVDLPETIDLINKKCKRGFFALPASDIEFISSHSRYGHVNICRLLNDVLHICKRPNNSHIDEFSDAFGKLWESNKNFRDMWEGHGKITYRFIWEARLYWEDKISYVFHENAEMLYPQLRYFNG